MPAGGPAKQTLAAGRAALVDESPAGRDMAETDQGGRDPLAYPVGRVRQIGMELIDDAVGVTGVACVRHVLDGR